jgi:hypothetical protein
MLSSLHPVTPLDFEGTSGYLDGHYRLHYHEAGFGPPLVWLHGAGPGVSGWSNFAGRAPGRPSGTFAPSKALAVAGESVWPARGGESGRWLPP